ncbi:MAG: cyclic nucleotide-binding domain-containing protein [Chloroflexota bacterium]
MLTPEMLAEFDLFKEVSKDTLREVAAISETIKVKKDDLVFREGERADKLHLLVSGSIALRVKLTSRPDSVTVSFVNRPHQTLGWSGVVSPNHYTASAVCEEDSELVAIPAEKFMSILENHPADGFKVMLRIATIVSDRLRNSRQALLKTL